MKNKLPEGWKVMKLTDISESISAGGTPAREKKEYWLEGTIPWLKIADMKSVYIKETEEKITKAGLDNSSAKVFPKGTLVYSIFATLGAIGILEIDATTNQAIAGITPKKNIISTKYLYYCLQAERDKILAKKSHATQDNLNLTILRNHEIVVPPLLSQRKIISILEKAEQAKELRKEADELTKDFFKSIFWQMFRSNKENIAELNLSEVAWFQEGPGVRNYQFTSKGVKLLNVRNIVDGELVLSNTITHISSDETRGKYKHFLVDEGDIIMASSGVTWGKTAIAKKEDLPLCMNTSTIRFKVLNNKITKDYLLSFLNSPYFTQQISRMITGGCQPNFGPSHLKQVKIPLPQIELQKKFASIVKEVEAMKEQQKHSKEQIDNLFNALMQKAFKGELV